MATENSFKGVNDYTLFDADAWSENHTFEFKKAVPGFIYVDGKKQAEPSYTKVKVEIVHDRKAHAEGKEGPNDSEQFNVKLLEVRPTASNLEKLRAFKGKNVTLVEPVVKLYGDRKNQLSISIKTLKLDERPTP